MNSCQTGTTIFNEINIIAEIYYKSSWWWNGSNYFIKNNKADYPNEMFRDKSQNKAQRSFDLRECLMASPSLIWFFKSFRCRLSQNDYRCFFKFHEKNFHDKLMSIFNFMFLLKDFSGFFWKITMLKIRILYLDSAACI